MKMLGNKALCLVAVNGSETMVDYDRLPWVARSRIADGPFNICPSCVLRLTYERFHGRFDTAIDFMCDEIRRTT